MLGYIFEIIDGVRYELKRKREGPRSSYSPPPAPPTAPHHTASTTAELPSPLQPIKSWSHPFGDRSDPLLQLTQLAKAGAGYYPLGRSGMWHGGVHFDAGTEGILDQSQVRCLADGEVVAYRIPEHTPTNTFFPEPEVTVEAPFASGFVLVRHRLEAPKIERSSETPPSLTFYSLYMHLQDWAVYQVDSTLARPAFWPEAATRRVKATVNDVRPGHPELRGLNVRNQAWQGRVLDLLPRGAEVTVSGEGDYRKLENTLGPAKLTNADGSLRGYVAITQLKQIAGNEYHVATRWGSLNVYAEPSFHSEVLTELQDGTELTVSGEGEYRKLEHINQYVHFKSLQGALEPLAQDRVVVLDRPIAIKAGDLIGHLGPYQESNETAPQKKLHLEVFSGADVQAFIEASRTWAQRLPNEDKTWLKLTKGTLVVTHQNGFSVTLLPILSGPNTPSGADLLVPKSLLDGLPADRKIQVPAKESRKACNWYRLDRLLNDADGNQLDGWVREDVGITPWVSHWSWEGYDTLYNMDTGRNSLAYFLKIIGHFGERELAQFGLLADRSDQSPMRARLYDIIDRNRDGNMTAEELQAALRLPAHAQAIAQLVMYHESEWRYTGQKWDALDEILGHSNSTPILNWIAEKRRIKQLSWWNEVAVKVGLPADGKVYYLQPIGLVGIFSSACPDECIVDVYEMDTSIGVYVVSKESFEFVLDKEGYEEYPYVPAGSSGVTVGYGYDLGQQAIAQVRIDLSGLYDDSDIERLVSVVGKKGDDARGVLSSVADISIDKARASSLAVAMKKRYANDVVSIYPKALELHPHCQGALLSLVINRGRSLVDREGQVSRLEMRQIKDDFYSGNTHLIPSRLEAMQKYWTSNSNRGVGVRRVEEAEYFRRGLECNCWK